jgi:ABC-type spermidine/putrescine transport system permease subunit II
MILYVYRQKLTLLIKILTSVVSVLIATIAAAALLLFGIRGHCKVME